MRIVLVAMYDGKQYEIDDQLELVVKKVNDARGTGKLINLTIYKIPTGQQIAIDPERVQTIIARDNR